MAWEYEARHQHFLKTIILGMKEQYAGLHRKLQYLPHLKIFYKNGGEK